MDMRNGPLFVGMTKLKAIRAYCLKCESGSRKAIRNCDTVDCPLFPYRLGHDPTRRGIGGGLSNFRKKFPRSSGEILARKGIVEEDG